MAAMTKRIDPGWSDPLTPAHIIASLVVTIVGLAFLLGFVMGKVL